MEGLFCEAPSLYLGGRFNLNPGRTSLAAVNLEVKANQIAASIFIYIIYPRSTRVVVMRR